MLTLKDLIKQTRNCGKKIVFPEASFSDRILKAASFINKKHLAKVVLIGDESALVLRYKNLKGMIILNPKTSDIANDLADLLFRKRKDKGMTIEEAQKLVLDPIYFGALLVEADMADCMVAGAETSSSKVIKAALQVVGTKNRSEIASSYMIIQGKHHSMPKENVMLLADVGLNINPTKEEIVQIANQTAKTAEKLFKLSPRVALLSYSTNGSAKGESAIKMKEAAEILKETAEYDVDGEMQLDSALSPSVCNLKFPSSKVFGNANVLIFPDLASGNISYKCIQRFGNLHAIGPIIQNLKKPINDLSRGATVEEIIFTSLLTLLI